MTDVVQALWDQMRAELRADVLPILSAACHSLLDETLGPLTELQIEDLESVDRSLSRLSRRLEGDPVDWTDYSLAAHALRGPLNTTIGFSRLLLKGVEGPINVAQREALETTYSTSRRLLALFNLLLDASMLLGNEIVVDLEPARVDGVLLEIISLGRTLADNHEFTFEADVATQVADVTVTIDAKRLKQALSALLTAVTKEMRDGPVYLKAWRDKNTVLIRLESEACELPGPLLVDLHTLLTDQADRSLPYDAHLRIGVAVHLLNSMGADLSARQTDERCTLTVTLPIM